MKPYLSNIYLFKVSYKKTRKRCKIRLHCQIGGHFRPFQIVYIFTLHISGDNSFYISSSF